MSAGDASDTIPFDGHLLRPHPHPTAVGATGYMRLVGIQRLVSRATKTVDRLTVQHPELPGLVHFRQDQIMMPGVVEYGFRGIQVALDQLARPGIINGV